MSDATDDPESWSRRLLQQSQSDPFRERMAAFVTDTPVTDVKTLRERTSGGSDLSTIVRDDREERL